ncbi:NAD(P)H-dependent oxidoreductase [Pseudomonas sp. Je.1.5.c]|uniref:FMN-dependent NADH-azoreductase n=1 Tax=Pseudomonas sp. Je.1.5.c TaxID=3142839 RepID=UPI003DA851B7
MSKIKILLLDCSPKLEGSASRYFTDLLIPKLAEAGSSDVELKRRSLGSEPLPAMTADYAESVLLLLEDAQQKFATSLALSDELIKELDECDVLWISTPVHNFTIPATLKNWIDYVVRRDVTFVSTKEGKKGLLRDRPTFVAVTSGGAMFEDPPRQPDFFRPYLKAILSVIGLSDITFIQATGLAFTKSPLSTVEDSATRWICEVRHPSA